MLNTRVKINVKDIFQYLFMFLVIVYGQTVWVRLNYTGSVYTNLTIILSVIVFMLICLNRHISARSFFEVVVLVGLLFIYYFFSQYGLTLIIRISVLLGLLVIYLWSLYDSNQILDFVKKYSDIVFIIAFVSIILYILGPTLNIIHGHDVQYYWAGKQTSCTTYLNLLYATQTSRILGRTLVRNSAIFCEAPSYAVPLLISLFIELFAKKKLNRGRISILLIAILTSFSTKAFLVVGVMVALKLLYIFAFDQRKNGPIQILRLSVPILFIIICFFMLAVLNQRTDSTSYMIRMDNIYSTLVTFRQNWLFGVGIGNETAVSQYSNLDLDWQGFSIGVTLLMAEGGIYITLFYLSSFIKGFLMSENRWLTFCTFVVYFAILFMSNISYFPSTIFALALGFSVHKRHNIKNKE